MQPEIQEVIGNLQVAPSVTKCTNCDRSRWNAVNMERKGVGSLRIVFCRRIYLNTATRRSCYELSRCAISRHIIKLRRNERRNRTETWWVGKLVVSLGNRDTTRDSDGVTNYPATPPVGNSASPVAPSLDTTLNFVGIREGTEQRQCGVGNFPCPEIGRASCRERV